MSSLVVRRMCASFSLLAAMAIGSTGFTQESFRMISWNVESNRPGQPPVSDAITIANQLKEIISSLELKSDIAVLCEVEPKEFHHYVKGFTEGLQSQVDYVTSASGGYRDTDSIMVLVNNSKFEILDAIEIHRFAGLKANFNVTDSSGDDQGELRARSPLAVKIKARSSGQIFWLIANHLARGEADLRTEQAKLLVLWAKSHPEPVIAAGDFNFDYDFKTSEGNDGFKAMMSGGVWKWLKPDPLVDSNWSQDRRVKDKNVDRYPDSILDFVFVANSAKDWKGKSDVLVRPGDFPDDEKTSDHRPLITRFEITAQ